MGLFNSGADSQHVCAVLKRREKTLTVVTSRKVDDIIEEAYALDPRLCGCIENWSGSQSTTGALGIKKTYKLNLTYAPYTPDDVNDIIIDDGNWSFKQLTQNGSELPDYIRVVTKSVKDFEKKIDAGLEELRNTVFGLTGVTYTTSQPSGEYTSIAVIFKYCVDGARSKMWMQSAQRKVVEIDHNFFGNAPKLIKVFLAFSYIQQNCLYDQETADLIETQGSTVDVSRPWVRLPYGPLCRGEGICEGIAAAYKLFMDYFGIDNQIVIGRAGEGSETGSHSWNMIKLGDQWFHVDPTAGIGGEGVYVGAFLKCDSEMEHLYLWDTSKYPRCIMKRPNYSSVELYVDEHFDELIESGVEEKYMQPDDISE